MQTGTQLGHYTVLAAIGRGGMGEVWKAKDNNLGREVAIKTLPEEFAKDPDRLARFEREARLLASLNHPNIAAAYGLEESGTARFLVLELVEGDTLADRLERGAIPIEESLKLALQIADALEAAHEKGVVHRDLKPANIKVTDEGTVKVLDFGLAKAFAETDSNADMSASPTLSVAATRQGVILGTAAYMSPEQAKGRSTDKRADIWAFGCVLYEMITGRPAFGGEDISEILASVIKGTTNLDLLGPRIHPTVRRIIVRCIEKDHRKRFRDIGDVRVEIEEALLDLSRAVPVEADSVPARPRKLVPAIALTAILSTLATVLVLWSLTPPESRLVRRFDYELPAGLTLRSSFPLLAMSPDGARMAFSTAEGIYLRPLDALDGHVVPGTEGGFSSPVFSPDGKWIAYWSLDTRIQRVPTNGGPPVTILEGVKEIAGQMAWNPDGTLLFVQSEGIFSVPSDGGPRALLIPARDGEWLDGPQLLPGGDYVLFTRTEAVGPTRWDEGQVVAESLQTGERQVLAAGGSGSYIPSGHLIFGRAGVLYAARFDQSTMEVGGAVSVLDNVAMGNDPQNYSGAAHFRYSDEGSLVYLAGHDTNSDRVLALVDRTGSVTRLPVPPRPYLSPRLSPNGNRLAVQTSGSDGNVIWTYDLSGQTVMRRLTLEGEGNNYRPVWRSSGDRIAFASDRGGPTSIYLKNADGSGVTDRLTTADKGTVHLPEAWSPDGRTLAYKVEYSSGATGNVSNEMDLWTVTLDAEGRPGEPQVFAAFPFPSQEMGATFSPDGRWIAYGSGSGIALDLDVYMAPFPPNGDDRIQISQESGLMPVWSRVGSELFFRPLTVGGSDQSQRLKSVRVSTEPQIAVTIEEEVRIGGFVSFSYYRSFDPTPDGQRFLVVLPAEDEASQAGSRPRFNIVLNWFEELKGLVPAP